MGLSGLFEPVLVSLTQPRLGQSVLTYMHPTPLKSPLVIPCDDSPLLSPTPARGSTSEGEQARPHAEPSPCRGPGVSPVNTVLQSEQAAHVECDAGATPLCTLLASVFGSRALGQSRAAALLDHAPLGVLARMDIGGLVSMGLTRPQAERLACAFELGRRVESFRSIPTASLRHPTEVVARMAPVLRGLEQETFHALLLDARHRLLHRVLVSVGTLTTSLVHPREVFRDAIRRSAAALVVVHNHPSGDPEPSEEDRAVTRRLIEVGEVLGIPLLDHVVIGDGCWVSLRERMSFSVACKSS